MRKVYLDEASAKRATKAEQRRLQRAPATFYIKLALGRADAYPEAKASVAGFRPELDGTTWLISEVTHRLNTSGGFRTVLKMETAP